MEDSEHRWGSRYSLQHEDGVIAVRVNREPDIEKSPQVFFRVVRGYFVVSLHHETMPQYGALVAGILALVGGVLILATDTQNDLYFGVFFLILGIVLVANGFSSSPA